MPGPCVGELGWPLDAGAGAAVLRSDAARAREDARSGRPDLYIGPQRQRGAPLLEIMVERVPPRGLVVFHVMEARTKFLALMDDEEDVR